MGGPYQCADAECCELRGALKGLPMLAGVDGGCHDWPHIGLHQKRLGLHGVHTACMAQQQDVKWVAVWHWRTSRGRLLLLGSQHGPTALG